MDKSDPKRIGILGGTFNPVHFGHLAIAKAAQEQAGLSKVIFIPAFLPPHKQADPIADSGLRYQMTKLAIEGLSDFEISSIEIDKKAVSYSIETIKAIKAIYPQSELFFIVGSDSVPELKTWQNINGIFKLCRMIVAKRPGHQQVETDLLPKDAIVLQGIYPDISSREIRQSIKQKVSIENLVPENVRDFILKNRLYI
jgi:nicotinate-nucleotide adenylyltransferase